MPRSNLLGAWGEAAAAEYLRKKGYRLAAANYRTRFGELDLVAFNRRFLVFVEVKLRKNDSFAQAREFVDAGKQDRLRSAAAMYLSKYPTRLQPRFDVIEIYAPEGVRTIHPVINHLEDAFQ